MMTFTLLQPCCDWLEFQACSASGDNANILTCSHQRSYATNTLSMASQRALTAVARSRPNVSRFAAARSSAPAFSTSAQTQRPTLGGQTEGPAPDGYRIKTPRRWNQQKESLLDQAANYFLLTEMARGMYVLLEQYFRPPYVPWCHWQALTERLT